MVPPSCHCKSCKPFFYANTSTPPATTLRRSLPQPPPIPPQPQRYSMPTRNLMPLYQTMPIRTHHSYGRPSATNNVSTRVLSEQMDANRLSLFSSFGKGEPAMNNAALTFDYNGNVNGIDTDMPQQREYGQTTPLEQRRTPYYYNELWNGDPSTDLSSHEENSSEALKPNVLAIELADKIDGNEEAEAEDCDGNAELQRNTLFNANLIGSSNGSLENII